MRTTVTLEPDVADRLREVTDQSGVTFKQAVNEALRAGLSMCSPLRFVQRSLPVGWRPEVDYERALRLAGDLEDDEVVRKLARADDPLAPTVIVIDATVLRYAVSVLRSELAAWIEKARHGAEVIVTERGLPVARLLPVDTAPLLEQLTRDGVLGPPPMGAKPVARGSARVSAAGRVADIVGEQRD